MELTIEERAAALGPWYHAIQLTPYYCTKPTIVAAFEPVWDMIRQVRGNIPYTGKSVLDLGTMDGMWAFEAEKLTTEPVVAADIWQGDNRGAGLSRFLLAREVLKSAVLPVPNAEVHDLHQRLIPVMRNIGHPVGFEIIQCLGLLYHVQNPLLALHQIRRCIHPGRGVLLLETACWTGGGIEPVVRFNRNPAVYEDKSTYWLPNRACLFDWLRLCGLRLLYETVRSVSQPSMPCERVALVCEIDRDWRPDENDIGAY